MATRRSATAVLASQAAQTRWQQQAQTPTEPCPHCDRASFSHPGSRGNHVRWCERRGGVWPPPRVPRVPKTPASRPDPREPCPHCGRATFARRCSRQMHILFCAKNPDRRIGRAPHQVRPAPGDPCPHCAVSGDWPTVGSRSQHVRQCPANPARTARGRAAPQTASTGAPPPSKAARVLAPAAVPAGAYRCPVCQGIAHAEAIGGGRCIQCKREGRS